MVPSVPVPGNHEQATRADGNRLSHHWRPQFTLPENGPPGLEETCFTLVYQNLLIIGLDSNREIDTQMPWLDKVLAENTLAVGRLHVSPPDLLDRARSRQSRSCGPPGSRSSTSTASIWSCTGHDHSYGRTGPGDAAGRARNGGQRRRPA